MLFNVASLQTLAVGLLMLQPALGMLDVKVKWCGTGTCGAAGPAREYSRRTCIPLSSTTHSVNILDRVAGCKLTAYNGGNCEPNKGSRDLPNNGCWSLKGKNSVRVWC